MATNTSVQGSVTLRKLRSGSTVGVSIWTSQQLFQTYEAGDTDKVGPDWTANPVTCKVIVSGKTAEKVTWFINDTPATGLGLTVDTGVLTINKNLVKTLDYKNGTLKATFTLEGSTAAMTKTADITIMQVTGSQYNVVLSADAKSNGAVSEGIDAVITAKVMQGSTMLPSDKLASLYFVWTSADGQLGDTYGTNTQDKTLHNTKRNGIGKSVCTVTSSDVDGMELFICTVKASEGGDAYDSSAIAIVDNTDPYRLAASVTEGTTTQDNQYLYDVAEASNKVKVTFKVIKNDGTTEVDLTGKTVNWNVSKFHSDTMKYIKGSSVTATIPDTTTSTGGSTTEVTGSSTVKSTGKNAEIYVHDCDYVGTDTSTDASTTPHNTNVIVQADCTLS